MTTRVGRVAMAIAVATTLSAAEPVDVASQGVEAWTFGTDPFAELWYHGLAMVGFDGAGRAPLYDARYAWRVVSERRAAGVEPTRLERERAAFRAALERDPAFEVLHFLPLHLADVPIDVALSSLEALDGEGTPSRHVDARARRELDALAGVLPRADQRALVADFVRALRIERAALPPRDAAALEKRARRVRAIWKDVVTDGLADFIAREGLSGGRVIVTPALGPEGRILRPEDGAIVVVGALPDTDPGAVVGAVVRELCFPAVRRAIGPLEGWFDDRTMASDVSDQAATRCGALLLEEYAPGLMAAYQVRFGSSASRAAFLSAAGFAPPAAAVERQLDQALRRELELDQGSRGSPGAAGR